VGICAEWDCFQDAPYKLAWIESESIHANRGSLRVVWRPAYPGLTVQASELTTGWLLFYRALLERTGWCVSLWPDLKASDVWESSPKEEVLSAGIVEHELEVAGSWLYVLQGDMDLVSAKLRRSRAHSMRGHRVQLSVLESSALQNLAQLLLWGSSRIDSVCITVTHHSAKSSAR